jgi:hypothetical protein
MADDEQDRRRSMTDTDRFAAKYFRHPITGCWLWTAATSTAGYGRIRVDRRGMQAHRVAYEMHVGPIPEGLQLDHLCRVRRCVNPAHLEPVTQRENIMRGNSVSAVHAAKTHCIHGHPFDGENTRLGPNGKRVCRACHRDNERQARRRAA